MSNHEVAVCQGTVGGCLDLVNTRILRFRAVAVGFQIGGVSNRSSAFERGREVLDRSGGR